MELEEFLEKDIEKFLDEHMTKSGNKVDIKDADFAFIAFKKDYEKDILDAIKKGFFGLARQEFKELLEIYNRAPEGSRKKEMAAEILKKIYMNVYEYLRDKEGRRDFIDLLREVEEKGIVEEAELSELLEKENIKDPTIIKLEKIILGGAQQEAEKEFGVMHNTKASLSPKNVAVIQPKAVIIKTQGPVIHKVDNSAEIQRKDEGKDLEFEKKKEKNEIEVNIQKPNKPGVPAVKEAFGEWKKSGEEGKEDKEKERKTKEEKEEKKKEYKQEGLEKEKKKIEEKEERKPWVEERKKLYGVESSYATNEVDINKLKERELYKIGMQKIKEGKKEEAMIIFKKLLEMNPRNIKALIRMHQLKNL